MAIKKLIEVALPLDAINEQASREKSIRHGHPSSLHLWWSRKPTAAARAVIFASLVDDPSSHPDLFPNVEDQKRERERLFGIIKEIVQWENLNNEAILDITKKEIEKYIGGNYPALLDPFAGGGSITFEAQRLGLEAHAHDLNPVAVIINKAMIDIPQRFYTTKSVHPREEGRLHVGMFNSGISEDVKYYGEKIKSLLYKEVGEFYPHIKTKQYGDMTVVAWIWARTVCCPNPACGVEVPLLNSFDLSKKKGHEHHIEVSFDEKNVIFNVVSGQSKKDGTVTRKGAVCPCCGTAIEFPYIREKGIEGKMGVKLAAIVGEAKRGRVFLSPTAEHEKIAKVARPENPPHAKMAYNPRNFNTPIYGLDNFEDLFSDRQLLTITALCDLLVPLKKEIENDAIKAGMDNDHITLEDGGKGALAYSEAIITYLAFAIDKATDAWSSLVGWRTSVESTRNTFSLQALPMVWSYAEANPFSNSCGNWTDACIDSIVNFINSLHESRQGFAEQIDAQTDCGLREIMVSTDPPYYDNIVYADLSDYFYIWMRKNLKTIYPKVFSTMASPKAEELVATPYRFDGDKEEASHFFEDGMTRAFENIYKYAGNEYPVTIYYAYKQQDADPDSSSGWETMLTAIIQSGFTINGTWPMRTEKVGRTNSIGSNALASSIVLVCRKRSHDAPVCTRRNFINELKRELRPALQKLQGSNIAPVDLAQSAIGPGIGVYSKYSKVLEADGTPMTVRSALKVINQELDLYFNEQDGDLDSESRFCVELYSQVAFNELKFGDANTLATAKNTSVAIMASHGTLYAQKGVVHLTERPELPERIHEHESSIWLLCQQLTYKMEKEGVEGCAKAIFNIFGSNAERAKDLAYRLYTIAERKHWAQEAYAYNALVVAWPEIQSRAAELKAIVPEQMTLMDFLQ